MKKHSSVFWLLLFPFTAAFSQGYYPLPESGVTWQEHHFFTYIPCITNETILHYFDGDTLSGGKLYKKIFIESKGSTFCTSSGQTSTYYLPKTYSGGLRQDTLLHLVFFIPKDSLQEKLLYDFNQNAGDTLPSFLTSGLPDPVLIEKTDSVLIDGSFRKRLLYLQQYNGCGEDTSALIEGIGNIRGLLKLDLLACASYTDLVCMSVNDVHIFGSVDTCLHEGQVGYNATLNIPPDTYVMNTYNEPDGSVVIHFNLPGKGGYQLHVTDVLGNSIKKIALSGTGSVSLSSQSWHTGFYFLVLYEDGKPVKSEKVVVF